MKTKAEVVTELLDMHKSLCETKAMYPCTSASQIVISAQLSTLSYAIELVRQLPDAESWQSEPDEDGWYWIESASAVGYVERCNGSWECSAWISGGECHDSWPVKGRVRKIAVPQG